MTSAMKDFLQMTDYSHQHSLVPCAALTQLEVGGNAISIVEAGIGQDHVFVVQSGDQWEEDLVVNVGGAPRPTDDFTSVIEQSA